MKIELTEEERKTFETIARSYTGEVLTNFLERLISRCSDIRTLEKNKSLELTQQGRLDAIQIIEENLLERLKLFSGQLESPDENDFV